MGEYARRKSDDQRIKIGTCASMYYLRYEDRHLVYGEDAPKDKLGYRWRLPFSDEDRLKPGEYDDAFKGMRLWKENALGHCVDYSCQELGEQFGTLQMTHPSGLLINVNCHHGERLPTMGEGAAPHWNGKSHSYELSSLKNLAEGVFPIIKCRHCNQQWRVDWADIWDFIPVEMRVRFSQYKRDCEAHQAA